MADDRGSDRVMIHVRVVEAKDVPPADVSGNQQDYHTSDPYCKVKLLGKKFRTRVIPKTLYPVWNEDCTFVVDRRHLATESIEIEVFDKDRFFRDDFLGKVSIPLNVVKDRDAYQGLHPLLNKDGKERVDGALLLKVVRDKDWSRFLKQRERFTLHRKSLITTKTAAFDEKIEEQKITLFVGTWNVGNAPPPDDLSAWIPKEGFDLYAIGAQECKYEARKGHRKTKDDWISLLKEHFGEGYKLIGHHSLWEMRLAVFAAKSLERSITHVEQHTEATGIASVLGNKGGVTVNLNINDTRVCFVNSHLAAHQHKVAKRNEDVAEIINGIEVGHKHMDILHQFHHVIWMGDLNYRLDYKDQGQEKTPSPELFKEMVSKIEQGQYEELYRTDQLRKEMDEARAFIGFTEGKCNFPPTFKVIRDKELEYSEQRSPAWCDRVLWRSFPGYVIRQTGLGCSREIMTSDHKPVWSTFDVEVITLPAATTDTRGHAHIRITGLKAKNIPKADISTGKADPYVVFAGAFLEQVVKTGHKSATLNPSWDDREVPTLKLTINNPDRVAKHHLMIQLWDFNLVKHKKLANGILPLEPFIEGENSFQINLFTGGLPAGTLHGRLAIMWETVDFRPTLLSDSNE